MTNTAKDNPIRVWLIEDNRMFASSVELIIDSLEGISCGGAFTCAEDAFDALEEQDPPDVILLDVQLPGIDGISALSTINERAPETKSLILTVFDDAQKIYDAVCAGAAGYVLKSSGIDEIGETIREVFEGGSPMTPAVARKVLDAFPKKEAATPEPDDYGLTEREREIIRLLADGLVKKVIADQLNLSPHTVSTHMRRVYTKLHVCTNTGAVAKALREGII